MVVTRIPPSPTGHLHIGTARTALFNYIFAQKHGGTFLFRSEDTDRARSSTEFESEIIEGLQWLGITWDNEGAILRQSERIERYRAVLEDMISRDVAYTSREASKNNPDTEVEVVRLRNTNAEITFTDRIRGEITFDTTELGDIVIARAIDDPLYHLTVVVDDMDMGVTHVLRGEDHISNTARQILIQEAIGAPRPEYAHLPLILAPDRSKLSKRNGAVALQTYRDEGYLPEALLNYLALLGWHPDTDQELFTLDELIEAFNIEDVQKGGAVFDIEKLKWINKAYLGKLSDDAFLSYIEPALPDAFRAVGDQLQRLVPEFRERIHTRAELREQIASGAYDFLVSATDIDATDYAWKNDDSVSDVVPRLQHTLQLLKAADFGSPEAIKASVWPYAEEVGKGEVLWPLRMALARQKQSPDPFTLAYALGRDETCSRIVEVCDKIQRCE